MLFAMAFLSEHSSRKRSGLFLWIFMGVFFVFVYMFLFPRGLGKDCFLVPVAAYPLEKAPVDAPVGQGFLYQLGGKEGALSPDGVPLFYRTTLAQTSVSGRYSAWYDPTADLTYVQDGHSLLFHKNGKAYPYWVRNRLYFIGDERMGLTEMDLKGNPLWSTQLGSLLTALDAGPHLTVLGTLGGQVHIFGSSGKSLLSFAPGGSRFPVIYNVAISQDEKKVLLISGLDPKRFLVLEKGGGDFRPVFHQEIKDSRPYSTPLGFLQDDDWAYYTTPRNLTLLNLQNDRQTVIPFQGDLRGITMNSSSLITAVTGYESSSLLHIWSTHGSSLLYAPFQAKDVLLFERGPLLLLIADQTVLVMKRSLE
jgi:hypothetical protein